MLAVIDTCLPDVILSATTTLSRDTLPRIAARKKAGLVTDVIEVDDLALTVKKPMFAGKAVAKLALKPESLRMISIRANSYPAKPLTGEALQTIVEPSKNSYTIKSLGVRKSESARLDLTEAKRIISGGRSLKNAENFSILKDCATLLNAEVGASRAAVDAGYAPHEMQVGQTGKTVSPDLYIACGISGAIQHLAGMKTAKTIVAINLDPQAAIFTVADYGIVGDLFEIVPALTAALKERV
jgi:electron transfer flavoprotein alpha subunit